MRTALGCGARMQESRECTKTRIAQGFSTRAPSPRRAHAQDRAPIDRRAMTRSIRPCRAIPYPQKNFRSEPSATGIERKIGSSRRIAAVIRLLARAAVLRSRAPIGRSAARSSAMRDCGSQVELADWRSDPELAPEQFVDRFGIGLAAGRFHRLADEPADGSRLDLRLRDLVGIGCDDLVDDLLDRADIRELLQAVLFDDLPRIAALAPDELEQVFGDFPGDHLLGDQVQNGTELARRHRRLFDPLAVLVEPSE